MEELNEPVLIKKQNVRPGTKGKNIYIIVLLLVLTVVSVTFSIFSFMKSHSVERQFKDLSYKFKLADTEFKAQQETFKSQDKSNKQFINTLIFNAIQHDMEGGVATEKLVLDKITFWKTLSDMGTSGTNIDVSTQPIIDDKYEGHGQFDLTDRELKSMLEDLLNSTETYYETIRETYKEYLPEWKSITHTISIQNYELGTYSDGVFKLKAE